MESSSLIITEDSTFCQPPIQASCSKDNGNVIAPSEHYKEELLEKNGIWYKAIYDNGCLKSLITLASDKTTYIQEVVFHDDGVTQKMIIPYANGVREGIVYVFHRNGKVRLIVPIKDGKKEGNRREYNEAGILIEECFYVADRKNGGYKKIDPYTGRCLVQAYYRNDCLEGDKKTFDVQGNLVLLEKFLNGRKVSSDTFGSVSNFEGFCIL